MQQEKPGIYGFETMIISLEENEQSEELVIIRTLFSNPLKPILTTYKLKDEDKAKDDLMALLRYLGAQGWEIKAFDNSGQDAHIVLQRLMTPAESINVLNSLDSNKLHRLHLI